MIYGALQIDLQAPRKRENMWEDKERRRAKDGGLREAGFESFRADVTSRLTGKNRRGYVSEEWE
jgi:hypothetical protein